MNVIVVGGGLLGSSVAWELAARGAAVTVLERAVPGAEASSAAAGILAPRVEAHDVPELAGPGVESLALYPEWIRRVEAASGMDTGFRRCGVLGVGDGPSGAEPVADVATVEPLVAPGPGWLLPEEAVVDPRRLVAAVHRAAETAKVRYRTGVSVLRLRGDGVHLGDGTWMRGRVVVCAGAWTSRVPGLPPLPVRPVRGQLVAVRGRSTPGRIVWGMGGYAVPRVDGRVVIGTTVEEVGFTRGVTVAGLHGVTGIARRLLPGLEDAEVIETWSGFRPGTPDKLPIVGDVGGVWVASGHYRNGILLAPITAKWVAGALLDGAAVSPTFSPARFTPTSG